MPGEGFEPTRPCGQRILSPLRLPISPTGPARSLFILRPAVRRRAHPDWRGGGPRTAAPRLLASLSPIKRPSPRGSTQAGGNRVGDIVRRTASAPLCGRRWGLVTDCSAYLGASTVQSSLTFRP